MRWINFDFLSGPTPKIKASDALEHKMFTNLSDCYLVSINTIVKPTKHFPFYVGMPITQGNSCRRSWWNIKCGRDLMEIQRPYRSQWLYGRKIPRGWSLSMYGPDSRALPLMQALAHIMPLPLGIIYHTSSLRTTKP